MKSNRAFTKITRIMKEDGSEVTEFSNIVQEISFFYKDLLGTKFESLGTIDPLVVDRGHILSTSDQELLNLDFSSEEIKKAFFTISNLKAPVQMVLTLISSRELGMW